MKSFRLTQISPIYQSIRQFANPQVGSGATIWDDVGTYLTQTIDLKEKSALKVAINYFKEKESEV